MFLSKCSVLFYLVLFSYYKFKQICFFSPLGRETEWLFSSVEGQKEIASNAGFERVVIATLGRGHTFTDMGTIKKELSTKVMELGPKKLSSKAQVMRKADRLLFGLPKGGGGGVLRISSDGDDRMGAKIKTPKNP